MRGIHSEVTVLEFLNDVLAVSEVSDPESARELFDAVADTWEVNGDGRLTLILPPGVAQLAAVGVPGISLPPEVIDEDGWPVAASGPLGAYRGLAVLLDPEATAIGAVISR